MDTVGLSHPLCTYLKPAAPSYNNENRSEVQDKGYFTPNPPLHDATVQHLQYIHSLPPASNVSSEPSSYLEYTED